MKKTFTKKIFTAKLFISDLGYLIWHSPKIIKVFTAKQHHQHLIEKILIVTDAVNECGYCSWLDAKLALRSGVSEAEIKNMLNLQFHTHASENEMLALLYAQHYAESNRNPDPDMTRKLIDYYGKSTANDIVLAIRMVTFGNLYFNTWGAIISRFKGQPAENSNVAFEIAYFLLNFIIILPFSILRKMDKKAIGNR